MGAWPLKSIHAGQAGEAAGGAELEHWERWAGIVLALGRDVFVADDVIQVVTVDQGFRGGEAGLQLSGREVFRKGERAAKLVPGGDRS